MLCPACRHNASAADFGTPAVCPACGAIYEKALVTRAKLNELSGAREQQQDRPVSASPPFSLRMVAVLRRMPLPQFAAPKKPLHVLIWLALAGFIVSLATQGSRPKTVEQTTADRQWRYEALAKQKVGRRLKDAESARWGEIFEGKAGPVCGSVNSKNSFGAYAGFGRFIVSGTDVVVLENDMPLSEFEKVWSSVCR